jgi:hypothetical protein
MLIRDGRTWRIRFNGVERPLRDLKGLQYLQKLVANPGKPTHVADLQGRGPVQITTKDPIVDRKTKAALRVQFEDATSQLDLAEQNDDAGAADAAREKMEAIRRALEEATSPIGTPQMSTESNGVRSAVAKSIKTALSEIKSVHPDAHAHLTQHLTGPTGFSPRYGHSDVAPWLVNLTATAED